MLVNRIQPGLRRQLILLVAALCLTTALTMAFMVAVVQIQSAVTAYTRGESIWSRAQIEAVQHFNQFARTGDFRQLALARQALAVPFGDLHARVAITAPALDWKRAEKGLLQGGNHPDDVTRMILLMRYLGWLEPMQVAMRAWEDTDDLLIEMDQIGNAMEQQWLTASPNRSRLQHLTQRLSELDDTLHTRALTFREAMGEAARWAALFLSWASIGFLVLVVSLSLFLGTLLIKVLRRSEQNFRSIFEQSAIGIAQLDTSGRFINANQAASDTLGYSMEELIGSSYQRLIPPEDWDIARESRHAINRGDITNYTTEHRLVRKDGDHLWARLTVSRVWEAPGTFSGYTIALEDISESHRLSSELSYMASHDSLTGLINRRAFEHQLASHLGRVRNEGQQHALCFIDLDQFKVANDTSGHDAGDELLRQVSSIILNNLRDADTLGRLGGDEFGLIIENCNLDQARQVAEKVRASLDHLVFNWRGTSHTISCSIGLVPITAESASISALMKAADIACYTAKDSGRNRVCVMALEDEQVARQRGEMEWLGRIQQALQEDRFFLEAQLIVPASRTKAGLRYEVLIRLQGPDGAVVPPNAFLPPAERYGLAPRIDRWVVTRVLQTLAGHPSHLKELDACHVNLSGRSFDQPDFSDFVVSLFNEYRVPPEKICFEITETAAVHSLLEVEAFMTRLGAMGCRFALDDFGSGLSSFGYLRRLPVTYLKIDGTFVRDMVDNEVDRAMVRAIHDIGHTMELVSVAEYVESEQAAVLLGNIGVDLIQGFWVHRPCALESLLERTPGSTGLIHTLP